MTERFDLILKGGTVVTTEAVETADLGVRDGIIVAIGDLSKSAAASTVDVFGLHVLPGVIDTQVHFREPGLEHKEDLASGSLAAVLGGVVAVFEMPNTKPATTTPEMLRDKLARAERRMWCDHAFFLGASAENADRLGGWERMPGCAGVKVFMGSSTGSLLVENEDDLVRVLASGFRRVAVHCEDEARLRSRFALVEHGASVAMHPEWRDVTVALAATERLLRLAAVARRRVHVLHVSTAEEMTLLGRRRDLATVEVTPQHLTLEAPGCYERQGTRAQMNPPVRDLAHQEALWRGVRDGVVDCLGSDHAPHTNAEKDNLYPASPSGMPGVQTLVPVMLTHVAAGRLSLSRFVDLTSAGPARIWGIAGKGRIAVGYDADFTVVDLKAERIITTNWLASRCGWSPFEGMAVTGWPMLTVVRGFVVMRDGEVVGTPGGQPVRFQES